MYECMYYKQLHICLYDNQLHLLIYILSIMSNTTQKKKWSVAILQSSMKKKVQKSFSSIILNILVNNSNKSSLEQIAKPLMKG